MPFRDRVQLGLALADLYLAIDQAEIDLAFPIVEEALRSEGVGLGTLRRRAQRLDVMGGDEPDQLVVVERLEVSRNGGVLAAAVGLRQRAVGDLADEPLQERILPALG